MSNKPGDAARLIAAVLYILGKWGAPALAILVIITILISILAR